MSEELPPPDAALLAKAAPPPPPTPVPAPPSGGSASDATGGRGRWLAALAVALIAGGAAVWLFTSGDGADDDADATTASPVTPPESIGDVPADAAALPDADADDAAQAVDGDEGATDATSDAADEVVEVDAASADADPDGTDGDEVAVDGEQAGTDGEDGGSSDTATGPDATAEAGDGAESDAAASEAVEDEAVDDEAVEDEAVEGEAAANDDPEGEVPESVAIVRGGQIYFEGAVPTQEDADRIVGFAIEIFGPDNVFNDYVVDPRASDPSDGDITVEDPITFDTDSAAVLPSADALLNQGLALLNLRPNMTVLIVGHTDSRGSEESNAQLSLERAEAVKAWFVERGVDPARLATRGAGESEPIGSNDTPEGRQLNRRTQFVLENVLG